MVFRENGLPADERGEQVNARTASALAELTSAERQMADLLPSEAHPSEARRFSTTFRTGFTPLRSRLATAFSRLAQSRIASSTLISSRPPEVASANRRRSLARALDALLLDTFDHLVDHRPLPAVEHLPEQLAAAGEVPVEAALGDAERPRQRLDPDGVRTAGGQVPAGPTSIQASRPPGSRCLGVKAASSASSSSTPPWSTAIRASSAGCGAEQRIHLASRNCYAPFAGISHPLAPASATLRSSWQAT